MRTADRESFFSLLWRRSRPLDRITGGYVILFALGLLVFGWHAPSTKYLLPVHVALLAAIAWMVVNWSGRTDGTTGFLRHLYPAILYTFFYGETTIALHWIFPGFFDAQIIALERAILGVDLNVWLTPFQSPLLNEWMMLGYFSYYLVIPALVLTLYFQGRTRELHNFLTAVTVTFVISYAGFVLYPVAGPRYFLAEHFDNPLQGWYFVPLVNWIIASAAIHGGCMPSSHVAVALVVLVWAYRTNRRLAYVMTPFVVTLFFATVWGRYHYLSDVVVGWLVGVIGMRVAARWCAIGRVRIKAESPAALSHVPVTY